MRTLRNIRRVAVVLAAGSLAATMTALPAQAGTTCGEENTTAGVRAQACWNSFADKDNNYATTYQPGMLLSPVDGRDRSKWSECNAAVRIYTRQDGTATWTRKTGAVGNCLAVVTQSAGKRTWVGLNVKFVPVKGTCYRTEVWWSGRYNGVNVGSSQRSNVYLCGTRESAVDLGDGIVALDDGTTDLPVLVPVPAELVELA